MNRQQINRWNIILGEPETDGCECCGVSSVLSYVYDHGDSDRFVGGNEKSQLTVPEWIANAKNLLPKRGFDILASHAIKKYNLTHLLTEDDILSDVKPDIDLLKTIMTFKRILSDSKLEKLRRIIDKVADELSEKMKKEVFSAINGSKLNFTRGYVKRLRNLNIKATIRRNLRTYDMKTRRLYPEKLIYNSEVHKLLSQRVILLVDQSGSMIDSVINTAVLSSILCRTKFLDVKVAAFDTSVVDLTQKCTNITEMLLSVQLGGGTDIGKALRYALGHIAEAKRTVVVLISDLCDGGSTMYTTARTIVQSGAKLLCLTAMDYGKGAAYDERAAAKLTSMGAAVAAKTPKELCEWIVRKTN